MTINCTRCQSTKPPMVLRKDCGSSCVDNDAMIVGALCMVHYLYHTSGVAFAEEVFGLPHTREYLTEKAALFYRSPTRAIGFLDGHHLKKLLTIALQRHQQAASEQAEALP